MDVERERRHGDDVEPGPPERVAKGESPTVILHIVEIRGRSPWWTWVIRDSAGVLVEESLTQFRSAADAELKGRARIADLEHRRRQRF
jgi:hypothetical protein